MSGIVVCCIDFLWSGERFFIRCFVSLQDALVVSLTLQCVVFAPSLNYGRTSQTRSPKGLMHRTIVLLLAKRLCFK